MSILPILKWPDPRLRQACAPIGAITPDLRRLADDMLETMYAAPGRGLAAPQVGEMVRLFVMDVTWKEGSPAPVVMVNPEVIGASPTTSRAEEACLSIPGAPAEVDRPETVTMRWITLDGEVMAQRLTGAAARCAQHELDHLDGKLILDRIDEAARRALGPALGRLAGA